MPTLLSRSLMPALLSCFLLLALLSPPHISALLSLLPVPASSSHLMPNLLSHFILGPALTCLISSTLKIFKRALSDKPLGRQSTSLSLVEPRYPFPPLGPLPEKSNCKRSFDMAFINSRPLARNHAANEADLSFGKYGCLVPVKLKQLWQFEPRDCKPVCIMEAISLAATLFWDPLFVPCPRHTIKLASKLGLKTWSIASRVVKERIELVWANKTIHQLDELFQNNLE